MAPPGAPSEAAPWNGEHGLHLGTCMDKDKAQSTGYAIVGLEGSAASYPRLDILNIAAKAHDRPKTNNTWQNEADKEYAMGKVQWRTPGNPEYMLGLGPIKVQHEGKEYTVSFQRIVNLVIPSTRFRDNPARRNNLYRTTKLHLFPEAYASRFSTTNI